MRWHLLALLVALPSCVQADTTTDWSQTVNGLRGRLVIPSDQKRGGDPFVHVYLELQNTLQVLGDRKVRYTVDGLSLKITDESGKALPENDGPYDGFSAISEPLVMPFDSTLRFLINGHGLGVPPGTHQILDFVSHCWIIPFSDGHSYFLSGTLTLPRNPADHPTMDWHGVLELPRVPIPGD